MRDKQQRLEKIILESDYPYSILTYKLINQGYFKKSINKIDNVGVPSNVKPNEITSADEQFLQLLNRFIEFFDDSFYFLHSDSICYIHMIIETNYKELEKYLLSKHYLGDNNYIDFFQDSIYRIIVSNFIKNTVVSKTLKNLFKNNKIPIKDVKDYTLDEILKINDLLSDIVLANAKNTFAAILLFDDIDKNISKIIKRMNKRKISSKDILDKKKSILSLSLFKIDSLIEEYEKKKDYLIFLK